MIKARIKAQSDTSNLNNYEKTIKKFKWDQIKEKLIWDDTGRINLAGSCVDRFAEDDKFSDQIALIVEKAGKIRRYSFQDLQENSCRWANMLASLGYEPKDRLFILLPSCAEIYFCHAGLREAGDCILRSSFQSGFHSNRSHFGKW